MNGRTAQLIEQVQRQLTYLSEDKIVEVLDFVQFLVERSSRIEHPRRGSLEALQDCFGIWEFESGELDRILMDIEQSRLMELDE